jgi:superoxide dismutase, Fe-Mn family
MKYTLPKLEYAYEVLEPYLDSQTMEIHHSKHHQAYIDNLNKALESHEDLQEKSAEELLKNLEAVPEEIRIAVKNNAGGHLNHSFFWTILKKDITPSGEILEAIEKDFQSLDEFKKQFKQAAITQFGSGWAWLVFNPTSNKLEITKTRDHESPITENKIPLLVIDVWEHAYYLKYQNKRPDYAEAFMSIINWTKVNEYFLNAKS